MALFKCTLSGVLMFLILWSMALLSGCQREEEIISSEETSPAGVVALEAVSLSYGNLLDQIRITGPVQGSREAQVVSETQGIIEKVTVQLGQRVRAGEPLVKVDSTIAKLTMEQAKEQLEIARIDLRTKEELLRGGGVSRAELARSQSAAAGAEAQYRSALKAFEDCTIAAPFDGSVAGINQGIGEGNYLNRGTPVLRIVNLDQVILRGGVGEQLVSLVRPGAKASIYVPAGCGDQVLEGTLLAVAAGSDPGTGSFTLEVGWKNTCGPNLRSGMSATAFIEPQGQVQRLILPSAALAVRGGVEGVFVDLQGQAVFKEILRGPSLGTRISLLSGLEEGDLVLVSGISSLSEGTPVRSTVIGTSGDWR